MCNNMSTNAKNANKLKTKSQCSYRPQKVAHKSQKNTGEITVSPYVLSRACTYTHHIYSTNRIGSLTLSILIKPYNSQSRMQCRADLYYPLRRRDANNS